MSEEWCTSCGDVIACPHKPNEIIVRVLEQENGFPAVIRGGKE